MFWYKVYNFLDVVFVKSDISKCCFFFMPIRGKRKEGQRLYLKKISIQGRLLGQTRDEHDD